MKLSIIALYPVEAGASLNQPGVRKRPRRDGLWAQVECQLQTTNKVTVARPVAEMPAGGPLPMFRAHLEIRRSRCASEGIAAVLQPAQRGAAADPEQRLVAPTYYNQDLVVLEFERAEVLYVSPNGNVELRFVAVDRKTGTVGTRTLARFHCDFFDLVERCRAHIRGESDLFPPRQQPPGFAAPIPSGPADLGFGMDETAAPVSADPSSVAQDDKKSLPDRPETMLREIVTNASAPIPLAQLAEELRTKFGLVLDQTDWLGHGSFKALCTSIPGLAVTPPAPGATDCVFDPTKHGSTTASPTVSTSTDAELPTVTKPTTEELRFFEELDNADDE